MCLLLAFLSPTTSASWIFPDRKQPAGNSRETKDADVSHKPLSLVSGQLSLGTPDGLTLLRQLLLQAERSPPKVPRSLANEILLINDDPPKPPFTESYSTPNCCSESGFKPSSYFIPSNPRNTYTPADPPTPPNTPIPIQTYNNINLYQPVFNSNPVITPKPALTFLDDTVTPYQRSQATTPQPVTTSYTSVFDKSASTTRYEAPTTSPDEDPYTVTTYRPKFNHNHRQSNTKSKYPSYSDQPFTSNTLKPKQRKVNHHLHGLCSN